MIMEPFIKNNEQAFSIKAWEDQYPGLVVGFTSKLNGFSQEPFKGLNFGFHVGDSEKAVYKNRDSFAKRIDFPLNLWVSAEQTHGIRIHQATKNDRGKGATQYGTSVRDTDGFYTFEKNLLLTLCFADCVPLYFTAPNHGFIGIAHAGWKGTVNKIAAEMVSFVLKERIPLNEVKVAIGPSICEKCYIVDDRVITHVQNILEDVDKKPYNLIKENQYELDLKTLNKQILMKEGIDEQNITVSRLCTSCDSAYFFSHRRDQGASGRMISFIGWKEEL